MQVKDGEKPMDLFEYAAEGRKEKEAPLAARMRPQFFTVRLKQTGSARSSFMYRPVWEKQPLRA